MMKYTDIEGINRQLISEVSYLTRTDITMQTNAIQDQDIVLSLANVEPLGLATSVTKHCT